jgi:hypothetical protein
MSEERTTTLKVVNMQFDVQKPPVFKEQRGKDWIMYGIDNPYANLYPQFLIDLYNRSAKHNAIVSGKAEYISANGWEVDGDKLNTESRARLERFINSANEDESLNDLLPKVATDLEVFNGFALEAIPKKGGIGVNIYHVPFQNIRSNKDNTEFYVSEDWKKSRPEYETFDAFDWDKPNKGGIIYVKMYRPSTEVYPIPSYIGAIPYILTDIEIANFHYNAIKNGFTGGTLINLLNGTPETEDAKREIYRDITNKMAGTDNANSIIINFADGKERAAEVISLRGNDFDKQFNILNDTVRKEIFSGHKITDPQLFGIFKDGAFSNASDLSDSWALFQNTYIEKRQRFIEQLFNDIAVALGMEGRLSILKVEPINVQLSEATVVSVMNEDEIREKAGLPVIVKEKGEEVVDSKSAESQAALKGSVGGVTGIITVLQNVQGGIIAKQSAIELLIQLYGFTREQAEAIVGGGEILPAPILPEQADQFHEKSWTEVNVAKAFKGKGYSLDKFEIVRQRPFAYIDHVQMQAEDNAARNFAFAPVPPIQANILDLINKDPFISAVKISQMVGLSIEATMGILQQMGQAGLIEYTSPIIGDVTQRIGSVTDAGKDVLAESRTSLPSFRIAYRYAVRDGAGAPIIPTTRPFCREMVNMSQTEVWDATQITAISLSVNRNVWLRGGGFWRQKGTNITYPHCRHEWEQVVITERNG